MPVKHRPVLPPIETPVELRTPPPTPEELLDLRIWKSYGRRYVPLAEMTHAHLLNVWRLLVQRAAAPEFWGRVFETDHDEEKRRYWGRWVKAVEEELAKRLAGAEWLAGYCDGSLSPLEALYAEVRP